MLLLDAIRTGAAPGTVHELARAEIPAVLVHKLSPHQIDMREVLALGQLRGTLPAELVAIGIEPAIVEMQLELSPVAEAALPALLDLVLARLAAWTAAEASPDRDRTMHELSLALEICRIAEEHLGEAPPTQLRTVGIEIGDDANVAIENFRFCLEALLGAPPFGAAHPELVPLPRGGPPSRLPGG